MMEPEYVKKQIDELNEIIRNQIYKIFHCSDNKNSLYKEYLDFVSRFHNFNYKNCLLLFSQPVIIDNKEISSNALSGKTVCPNIKWQKDGYQLKKANITSLKYLVPYVDNNYLYHRKQEERYKNYKYPRKENNRDTASLKYTIGALFDIQQVEKKDGSEVVYDEKIYKTEELYEGLRLSLDETKTSVIFTSSEKYPILADEKIIVKRNSQSGLITAMMDKDSDKIEQLIYLMTLYVKIIADKMLPDTMNNIYRKLIVDSSCIVLFYWSHLSSDRIRLDYISSFEHNDNLDEMLHYIQIVSHQVITNIEKNINIYKNVRQDSMDFNIFL